MAPSCPTGLVEAQLEKILSSSGFRGSRRRQDLLRWSVRRVLERGNEPVKEHRIGLEVFGKPESWDPRVDPSVRVEFNRLRQKLGEFYGAEGIADLVVIEFPLRGYLPVFRERSPADPHTNSAEAQHGLELAPPGPAFPELSPPDESPVAQPVPKSTHRWLVWVLPAAAIFAMIALGVWWKSRTPTPPVSPLSSVAVLPFAGSGGDPGDAWLSDGLTDELTSKLTANGGLRVIARTSAFQFRGSNVDVRRAGRELQVGSVVEGSVLRSGNTLRVIAHLDRTEDGVELWSSTYERNARDLLQVEDEIAQAIASALRVKLTPPEPSAAPYALNEAAHDEYLRGVFEVQKLTPEGLRNAATRFENALKLAPRYAQPYVALGTVHLNLAGYAIGGGRKEMETAQQYFERAAALDPNLAEAQANLAYVGYVLDWNWPLAEARFRQALRLAPSAADVHDMFGFGLMTRGRFQEAEAEFRGAIERDPLNNVIRLNFGNVLDEENRPADAMKQFQFGLARSPDWFPGHLMASYAAIYAHHPEEALQHIASARKIVLHNALVDSSAAGAYAEMGRSSEAGELLKEIQTREASGNYVRYLFAIVDGLRGDRDGVFHWLEQSAELREQQILYIKVEPLLAPYRNDPRMIALEQRVGLL